MVIAGKAKVPKESLNSGVLELPNKFDNVTNRSSFEHDISYFENLEIDGNYLNRAKELKIKKVSVSPSRWRNYDEMCAISWRINKL
jgi:hypothetical protein